jgi:hypothetical protein
MLDINASYQSHLGYFNSNKIDSSYPGFYDDRRFLELERQNPTLLSNYASFVSQIPFDKDYLGNTEKTIRNIATLLNQELQKDGRQGACIDVSMALGRMLEKEGIWNYQVKGSLVITFPPNTHIPKKYFWPVDQGNYVAAHAWVVAPPFKIVDITIRQQPYIQNEKNHLPEIILQKETAYSKLELDEIISPPLLPLFKTQYRNNKAQILNAISPDLTRFNLRFKPEIFENNGISYKYSGTGIMAPDKPFEKATSLQLNGRYGMAIYQDIIKPQLT